MVMDENNNINPHLKLGMMFGGTAALIWGAWPVITALGVDANLTAWELAFLRVFIAGPLLLPWALRGIHRWQDWAKVGVMALLAGTPYSFIVSSGFQYTNATHGGVIIPGTIMLVGLLASHFFLHDRLDRYRILGGSSILVGLFLLAFGAPQVAGAPNSLIGDLLFFTGGCMWAAYTLLLRVWPMDAMTVTARVALASMIGTSFVLPFAPLPDFGDISTSMLTLQAVWQGCISSVIAIIFFTKGVGIMGPARAAVLNAIIPVVSTLLAFLILDEIPTALEGVGLLAILVGIGTAMFLTPRNQRPKAVAQAPQKA